MESVVKSVLQFKFAWLEYVVNPENKKAIQEKLDNVLNAQNDTKTMWNNNLRLVLRSKMETLCKHLGPEYIARVQQMYQSS